MDTPLPFDPETSALLRDVPATLVTRMATHCPRLQLPADALLLHPERANHALYVILRGSLQVRLSTVQEHTLTILQAGDCVGEMSLLEQTLPSAIVTAREPTELLRIERPLFWELVEHSHTLARNLLQILSGRLRHGNQLLEQNLLEQERFRQDAVLDPLTGLHNRRWLDREFPRALEAARRQQRECSLLMLDVDHFKRYNDEHGHQAGDQVLKQLAQFLRSQIRTSDLLSRYGGEEFVILLPDTPAVIAQRIAERLCRNVATLSIQDSQQRPLPPITLSIGIASLQTDDSWSALLTRADKALYQAKTQGRNRFSE